MAILRQSAISWQVFLQNGQEYRHEMAKGGIFVISCPELQTETSSKLVFCNVLVAQDTFLSVVPTTVTLFQEPFVDSFPPEKRKVIDCRPLSMPVRNDEAVNQSA